MILTQLSFVKLPVRKRTHMVSEYFQDAQNMTEWYCNKAINDLAEHSGARVDTSVF